MRYVLDSPRGFRRDPSDVPSGPRISEMMAVGLDRLIVLERTEQTAKLREIELAGATDIAGSNGDDAADARKSSWFAAPASRGASLHPIRKRLACRGRRSHPAPMPPYVPKYVRPEDAARSRALMIRRLIWAAAAIPLAFVFFVFSYSDQAPAGLRNAVIAFDRSIGFPIIGLLSKVLG